MAATPTSLARVIPWLAAAKAYGLLVLFLIFQRTPLREEKDRFLFVPSGATRQERLEVIKKSFWERLAPYDGQWYLDIAVHGYRRLRPDETLDGRLPPANFAFFPLVPWLIRSTRAVFPGHFVMVTVLVVITASTLGGAIVWLLARKLGLPAHSTLLLLLAFPTAAFQYVLYTEGLFLCFSALTLHFALGRRSGPAALCGAIAGLARPQGILLALPLFVELALPHLKKHPIRPRGLLVGLLAAACPFAGFVVMSTLTSFGFLGIQAQWGRSYNPFSLAATLFGYGGPPLDLLGVLLGIGLVPVMWRRLPVSLAIYGTGMVLMPLGTGSLLSIGRFISVSIPHFLALAALLGNSRVRFARDFALAAFLVLQAFLAKGLVGWYFVG